MGYNGYMGTPMPFSQTEADASQTPPGGMPGMPGGMPGDPPKPRGPPVDRGNKNVVVIDQSRSAFGGGNLAGPHIMDSISKSLGRTFGANPTSGPAPGNGNGGMA